MACGVHQASIKPRLVAVRAESPNSWISRELLSLNCTFIVNSLHTGQHRSWQGGENGKSTGGKKEVKRDKYKLSVSEL